MTGCFSTLFYLSNPIFPFHHIPGGNIMNAQEIIEYIRTSEKKTPVKVYGSKSSRRK